MKAIIEKASQAKAHDDEIVVLGVASVETKGGGGDQNEPLGHIVDFGISEE